MVAGTSGSAFQQTVEEQAPPRISAEFSESGIALISTKLVDGTPVEVRVRNTPITAEAFPYEPAYERGNWAGWGAWWGETRTAVTAMNVKVGDEDVRVSMSAYSDLASAHHIIFEDSSSYSRWTREGIEHTGLERAYFRVTVRGGDAGVSYSAQLEFSSRFLERRTVWLNEQPTAIEEVTIYRTR
jgi:hypothetical protein